MTDRITETERKGKNDRHKVDRQTDRQRMERERGSKPNNIVS
jgi:hypothetical protein